MNMKRHSFPRRKADWKLLPVLLIALILCTCGDSKPAETLEDGDELVDGDGPDPPTEEECTQACQRERECLDPLGAAAKDSQDDPVLSLCVDGCMAGAFGNDYADCINDSVDCYDVLVCLQGIDGDMVVTDGDTSTPDGDAAMDGDESPDGDWPDGDWPDGDSDSIPDGDSDSLPDGDAESADADPDVVCHGECGSAVTAYCEEDMLCACTDGQWSVLDCAQSCRDSGQVYDGCVYNADVGYDTCRCLPAVCEGACSMEESNFCIDGDNNCVCVEGLWIARNCETYCLETYSTAGGTCEPHLDDDACECPGIRDPSPVRRSR